MHFRLIQEIYLRALGSNVVDLIDLFLQFRQFALILHHEHDLQTMLLRWRQEDQATQVADVLGVVGKVGVEFEVEVDVEVLSADDAESVGVFLLVEDEQA